MLPTVHCLLTQNSQAENVLQQLRAAGVPDDDIDYIRYGSTNRRIVGNARITESNADSRNTKLSGGATAGAIAGAAAGMGVITAVGFTPLLVLAPAVITIGAAIGAMTGTVVALTALGDYGVPEKERNHYEKTLRTGGALLAVRSENEKELQSAAAAITRAGAQPRLIRMTKTLG